MSSEPPPGSGQQPPDDDPFRKRPPDEPPGEGTGSPYGSEPPPYGGGGPGGPDGPSGPGGTSGAPAERKLFSRLTSAEDAARMWVASEQLTGVVFPS